MRSRRDGSHTAVRFANTMTAFALMRAQRRLAGCAVVALLILVAIAAGHHHRLEAPAHALEIGAPSTFGPMTRTTDCVVCRVASPAPLVVVDIGAPPLVDTSFVSTASADRVVHASFRPCSPRAPPTAA